MKLVNLTKRIAGAETSKASKDTSDKLAAEMAGLKKRLFNNMTSDSQEVRITLLAAQIDIVFQKLERLEASLNTYLGNPTSQ